MNDIRPTLPIGLKFVLSILLLTVSLELLSESDSEIITAIILINREAELVDMDRSGEILKRHIAIPDYFTSGRSHNSSLRRSLRLIKDYGHIEPGSHFLPGSSKLPAKCLQTLMLSYKEPLERCTDGTQPSTRHVDTYISSSSNSDIFSSRDISTVTGINMFRSRTNNPLMLSPKFYLRDYPYLGEDTKQRKRFTHRLRHGDSFFT